VQYVRCEMTTKSQPTARRERERERPPPFRLPLPDKLLSNIPYSTPSSIPGPRPPRTTRPNPQGERGNEEEKDQGRRKKRMGPSESSTTTTTTKETTRASIRVTNERGAYLIITRCLVPSGHISAQDLRWQFSQGTGTCFRIQGEWAVEYAYGAVCVRVLCICGSR
jgi:hypothetical protein